MNMWHMIEEDKAGGGGGGPVNRMGQEGLPEKGMGSEGMSFENPREKLCKKREQQGQKPMAGTA